MQQGPIPRRQAPTSPMAAAGFTVLTAAGFAVLTGPWLALAWCGAISVALLARFGALSRRRTRHRNRTGSGRRGPLTGRRLT